ncbi:MAG: SMR family transporter [Candidatus Peribacteraceae bacterium]|nr:SMR family transporter [Candidatus Peribacteraceae bacterium]
MLYLLVIGILISETIAMSFLKEYSVNANLLYYFLGLLFYVGVTLLLVKSFSYEGMSVVNVLWSAFSILFVVGVGIFFFREKVHPIELVGISMVLGGVVVLRVFGA